MNPMNLLIRFLVTVLALFVAAWLVPGITVEGNAWIAVGVTAVVLGLVNMFIKPILQLLSCGCIVLTLGLFLIVINGLVLWLAGYVTYEWLDAGFKVDGFWPALWGGLIISVVSFLANVMLPEDKEV
jgi:putative membrane protein